MKPIQKAVKVKEEYYIEFTDEELKALNMEKGQKYSCKLQDGGLMLEPFVKMEIEIGSWDREILEMLIEESCERDVSVNQVINDILEEVINIELPVNER
jgi:hypothetical protein